VKNVADEYTRSLVVLKVATYIILHRLSWLTRLNESFMVCSGSPAPHERPGRAELS